jgi:hypothetical protein
LVRHFTLTPFALRENQTVIARLTQKAQFMLPLQGHRTDLGPTKSSAHQSTLQQQVKKNPHKAGLICFSSFFARAPDSTFG